MKKPTQTVQSIDRALQILECFTLEHPQLSIAEISQLTLLSKSTVFRLLATLAHNNYIQQDLVTHKYSLGFKLFYLGSVVSENMDLRNTALPFMRQLSDETSETVNLNIINQGERVCIEMIESSQSVRNHVKVGQTNCLCLGASGKVLLANIPESEAQKLIESAINTNRFIKDEELLQEELQEIRRNGYALSKEDRIKGTFSVTAPIFDYSEKLVGGISVAGPIQRLSEDRISTLQDKVKNAAKQISRELGYSNRNSENSNIVKEERA